MKIGSLLRRIPLKSRLASIAATRSKRAARQDLGVSGITARPGIRRYNATAIEDSRSLAVAQFTGRELHLVKKALAIAVLAIERQPGPFQSTSDQADMKAMLDRLIGTDTELAHYARAARIAVTGEPD
jgi:hypothetical protein